MPHCLSSKSHHLNQCWLIISRVLGHSPQSNSTTGDSQESNHGKCLKRAYLESKSHSPGGNELQGWLGAVFRHNLNYGVHVSRIWTEKCQILKIMLMECFIILHRFFGMIRRISSYFQSFITKRIRNIQVNFYIKPPRLWATRNHNLPQDSVYCRWMLSQLCLVFYYE